jgi:hypothetical protein
MSNIANKKTPRNPIAVAMMERYGHTITIMRDRRKRREKDAKKSWQKEEW